MLVSLSLAEINEVGAEHNTNHLNLIGKIERGHAVLEAHKIARSPKGILPTHGVAVEILPFGCDANTTKQIQEGRVGRHEREVGRRQYCWPTPRKDDYEVSGHKYGNNSRTGHIAALTTKSTDERHAPALGFQKDVIAAHSVPRLVSPFEGHASHSHRPRSR